MTKPGPASPRQIAMFGHVAISIRKALEAKDWTVGDLNQAMGRERGYAGAYHWMKGKGAPSPAARKEVSKLLGIPEEHLMAKEVKTTSLVALPPPKVAPMTFSPVAATAPKVGDVLTFSVDRNGMTRIKLDAVMPLETGAPLLRMLLDAGIVMSGGGDGDG
jgi:hypothetical protein